MSADRIAFIGAGNMASALAGGLVRAGAKARHIVAADPDAGSRERIARLGVATTADNRAAAHGAAVVVLAVKPQLLRAVATDLADTLTDGQLVLSIAAGVPIAALGAWLGITRPIVRCMPNTPALYGAGISALFANGAVGAREAALAERIMDAAGEVVWVTAEEHLDAVTALSGSGPAYYFYFMEAMITAGIGLGLDAGLARRLTLATAYGAAVMARHSEASPTELRRNVTSPGGTTERAIAVLEARQSREAIEAAMGAAAVRSRELAAEFGA
jgi:pyrroline-5-carboxylate reductase